MKRLLTFWLPISVMLFILSIFTFGGIDIIFNTKKVPAQLIDSYGTFIVVEDVPRSKSAGDTIWVLRSRFKPYPYVYLTDSSFSHYQAILKQ